MSENINETVYILDSYGLIYRAYFALINHPMTNKNGENISAVMIFFRNLKALLSKYKPGYLAAAFDSCTKTFRHQMYPEYKATRMKTPEDLHAQVPWIEDILTALNVPVLRVDGYEADDIIATVAKKCAEEKRPCRILSADKDLLQLVTPLCKEMQPNKENGGWEENGIEEVMAKWGIGPEKILDYLSLVGDTADNVPGVKGVGEKTALKLLNEYGTLDGIYAHKDEIKGAIGNKIRDDEENAYFSKKLITLCDEVPIEIDFEKFSTSDLDYGKAGAMLYEKGAAAVAKSFIEEAGISLDEAKKLIANNSESAGAKAKKQDSSNGELELNFDAEPNKKTVSENDALPEDNILPEVKPNKGNYSPCTKLLELTAFIDSVLSSGEKAVAFDTETDSLNATQANLIGFSLCNKAGTAIYVPVVLPGGMFAPETIEKSECIKQLSRILMDSEATLIMHNGKYDLEVLYANGFKEFPACKIFDTMVAAWLINPDTPGKSPFSLESLGETKLGLKGIEFSDIVPKGQTFADLPLETAFPYGAEDADFTWQLYLLFKEKIQKHGLEDLFYNMEMKVLPVLASMEETGIHLDKQTLADYAVELTAQIADTEAGIYKEVGHEFNIASTKQLQTVLFEERGLKPLKKTKTGYSTDTAVLEELSEMTTDPVPKMILEYRSKTKLLSTYVETLPEMCDKEERIHTSFLQTGTATGRLSSRDPNLQNIPVRDEAGRKIRSAFTATPGTVLISADYAQIELVVLAHLSGDVNLCKAFKEGTDVHRSTAALVYGIAPDAVTPQMRRFAKTVNFGVMYGMSAFSLAKDLGISRTEAKNFMDAYFENYYQVEQFLNKTISGAENTGYVETIMKRRRYIAAINSKNKLEQAGAQRIARNTPIQGSAADIVKKAMIDVNQALREKGSQAKMLLQVHDELIFQCPDDPKIIEETISLIKEKMENAVKLAVPLRVSIEYGKNWGEFH